MGRQHFGYGSERSHLVGGSRATTGQYETQFGT